MAPFLNQLPSGSLVGIDMPIGLLDAPRAGGRGCDQEARHAVGCRSSSVFSAPTRAVLHAADFGEVTGLTIQAFHLLPKIRELDEWITPERQSWVREFHPELCFTRLIGAPASHPKRTAEGRNERLLALPPDMAQLAESSDRVFRRQDVAPDDIVDALAVLCSVTAWGEGRGIVFPRSNAPTDARHLSMLIQG